MNFQPVICRSGVQYRVMCRIIRHQPLQLPRPLQQAHSAVVGCPAARWAMHDTRRRRSSPRQHAQSRADSPKPEDRVRLELLACGTAEDGTVGCGGVDRGTGGLAERAQRVLARGCAAGARSRHEAAGSSGQRTCLGEHVERELQQLALLLFSCRRKRCRGAPASARSAPARQRRERPLEAR